MPGPAVYVFTVIGVVAAGMAFKEFVYEPHIKPRWEARRRARRQRQLVPVSLVFSAHSRRSSSTSTDEDETSGDDGDNKKRDQDRERLKDLKNMKDLEEWKKEGLFEMEASGWRSSQTTTAGSSSGIASSSGVETDTGTLRPRNRTANRPGLDETFPPMMPTPASPAPSTPTASTPTPAINSTFLPAPGLARTTSTSSGPTTHVISTASPSPSTTVASSRLNSPLPPLPKDIEPEPLTSSSASTSSPNTTSHSLYEAPSTSTLRSPPLLASTAAAEDPFSSPALVPSLSFSLPHESDNEGELVSPPSSRAISPPVSLSGISHTSSFDSIGSPFVVRAEEEGSVIASRPMSPFSDFSQISSHSDDEEGEQTRTHADLSALASPELQSLGGSFVSEGDAAADADRNHGLSGSSFMPPLSWVPPPSWGASFVSDTEGDASQSQSYYYTPSNSVFISPSGSRNRDMDNAEGVISLTTSPTSPRSPLSSVSSPDSEPEQMDFVIHDYDHDDGSARSESDFGSEISGVSTASEESWASVGGSGPGVSGSANGNGAMMESSRRV
ncbi:hypothetical protein K435DRAFT_69374 [Dendrothele bispora CBS 962.96]|uniref:Uncharacterized protein n=1 Tax=Dendrothele bispora (strain CBS 962.96) TaxID=1314807 RepID=A0A4S8M4W8_DENBC|nr:hypothetical protein K435DRAFT_69374 [Dendrothele bispora CBS 962.96]